MINNFNNYKMNINNKCNEIKSMKKLLFKYRISSIINVTLNYMFYIL